MEGRSDIESPGSGFQQSQYTFDKGSLSTTVGTDDTQKITFVDSQVYIMQYGPVIVSGAEVLYLYNGDAGIASSSLNGQNHRLLFYKRSGRIHHLLLPVV